MDDPHSYYYYERKQRERYKRNSKLIRKINIWLTDQISDVRQSHPTWDAEPDKHKIGILDGRHECATNLLYKIKEWQEELKEWQEDKEKYYE